jgi:hypothetical protein
MQNGGFCSVRIIDLASSASGLSKVNRSIRQCGTQNRILICEPSTLRAVIESNAERRRLLHVRFWDGKAVEAIFSLLSLARLLGEDSDGIYNRTKASS